MGPLDAPGSGLARGFDGASATGGGPAAKGAEPSLLRSKRGMVLSVLIALIVAVVTFVLLRVRTSGRLH
jgi:hypothetical protein